MVRQFCRLCPTFAVLGAALLGAGCGGGGSPKDGATDPGKPAFSLTSGDFFAEFEKNNSDAHAKYKDKTVELTGKLVAISNDPKSGKAQFWLEGPDPAKNAWPLCTMTERYPWKNATPGQTVKVKGKGHPAPVGAQLVDCVVVEATGDRAPELTADALAKEQAAGTAAKKYENKYLIVSGEIDKLDVNSGVFFKTDAKGPKVVAHFGPEEFKKISSWKPGQKIEVIGLSTIVPGASQITVMNCQPMDDPK
jgi:hypothetical protein